MAKYGAMFRNSYGEILIDGNHIHPHLHHEMTVTIPQAPTYSGIVDVEYSFPPTDRPVFVMWHATSGSLVVRAVLKNANGEYYRLVVARPQQVQSSISAIIRIYHVPEIQTPPSGSNRYGMEIWNENGHMVFSTDWKSPIIVASGVRQHPILPPTYPERWAVDFPPQEELPFVYLSGVGTYSVDWSFYYNESHIYLPFAGRFTKNSEGLWYRFHIDYARWWWAPGEYLSWHYHTTNFDYVVFKG